jgi:glucokinase
MPSMLLAGDVGGTRTRLGLFRGDDERPMPLQAREFATLAFQSLDDIVQSFLKAGPVRPSDIDAACFGVAGPVADRVARLTNVPWLVDSQELAERIGLRRVGLVNDLAAMAHAVPVLEPHELSVLQEGITQPEGNAAVIAAGTGLGEALLHNVNGRFIPSPSEAGHADFAARTPQEMELVTALVRQFNRAELEAVLSGPGLVNLYNFTHPHPCKAVGEPVKRSEMPTLITAAALEQRCPHCEEVLNLFVGAYGAEAGNLALRSMATAGIYLGGGIALAILPALQGGTFLEAFRAKEPMVDLLATIPVSVILYRQAGLLGAAVRASELASGDDDH